MDARLDWWSKGCWRPRPNDPLSVASKNKPVTWRTQTGPKAFPELLAIRSPLAPVREFLIDWIENCLMIKFWVVHVSKRIVRAPMKSAPNGRNGLHEAQQDCARSFSKSALADVLSLALKVSIATGVIFA